jgi:hypothetical protein
MHQEGQRSVPAIDNFCPILQDVLSCCGSVHKSIIDTSSSAAQVQYVYISHPLYLQCTWPDQAQTMLHQLRGAYARGVCGVMTGYMRVTL